MDSRLESLKDLTLAIQEVEGFHPVVAALKNGRAVTGMIASETAAGITLKRAEAQTETLLRADIDEIQSTGQSLMPEGLEKAITVPEMGDLLAFLKATKWGPR